MKWNRYIVVVASIITAGTCIFLWAVGVGAMLDVPILSSAKLVSFLTDSFAGSALIPEAGWARFYIAILAFFLPTLVMTLFCGIKAALLPRNITIEEAWSMEMYRAHKNTWALWSSLGGNFR